MSTSEYAFKTFEYPIFAEIVLFSFSKKFLKIFLKMNEVEVSKVTGSSTASLQKKRRRF